MSTRIVGLAPVEFTVRARHRAPVLRTIATLAAVALLTGGVALARAQVGPVPGEPGGAGPTGTARLGTASSALAAAIAPGGMGFGFFAVQRTTEYARKGGPSIPLVDPADGRTVTGQTDHLFINAMMSKGVVSPDGFFMEMHLGSDKALASADFATAPAIFSVLARNGATWRNDGAGWYATTELPGMGIDLATARLLPRALGRLGSLTAAGADTVSGTAATVFTGSVALADYPGALASDGAAFTDPAIAVKVWVDAKDRPLQLWIRARNTNQPDYDLYSDTTVTLDVGPAAPLPQPNPTLAPEPPLPPDPATSTTAP